MQDLPVPASESERATLTRGERFSAFNRQFASKCFSFGGIALFSFFLLFATGECDDDDGGGGSTDQSDSGNTGGGNTGGGNTGGGNTGGGNTGGGNTEAATPEAATPEAATPEAATPEAATPEAATPEGLAVTLLMMAAATEALQPVEATEALQPVAVMWTTAAANDGGGNSGNGGNSDDNTDLWRDSQFRDERDKIRQEGVTSTPQDPTEATNKNVVTDIINRV